MVSPQNKTNLSSKQNLYNKKTQLSVSRIIIDEVYSKLKNFIKTL